MCTIIHTNNTEKKDWIRTERLCLDKIRFAFLHPFFPSLSVCRCSCLNMILYKIDIDSKCIKNMAPNIQYNTIQYTLCVHSIFAVDTHNIYPITATQLIYSMEWFQFIAIFPHFLLLLPHPSLFDNHFCCCILLIKANGASCHIHFNIYGPISIV